jgi:ferredoxin
MRWAVLEKFRRTRISESADPKRRRLLIQGLLSLLSGLVLGVFQLRTGQAKPQTAASPVRPPTANPDDTVFISKCIRCGLCGLVCENGCIRFFGSDEETRGRFTPFLDVRERSCTLCMRCTQICPTGALTATKKDFTLIVEKVNMGKARVDPDLCLSYLGRVCGYCHDACPIATHAIKLVPPASPVVLDGCVGCGRCVELCPQNPTAIAVVPATLGGSP